MNIENKICVVTGANSGIGKKTAKALAGMGAYIVMICRNAERARQAKQEIIDQSGQSGVEIMIADLAHQYDIRNVAKQFNEKFDALDILINNAGMVASTREETPDGIEKTLAVNHLGPFLLTNLLMPSLKNAASARIINVSSEVHRIGAGIFDLDNLQLTQGYSNMKAYGLSKLCNIMFTHELSKRLHKDGITANCLHPGVVGTRLASDASWWLKLSYILGKPFMRSPKKGSETPIYLASSGEVENTSGKYFKNKSITAPAAIAFDDDCTTQLWHKSAVLADVKKRSNA